MRIAIDTSPTDDPKLLAHRVRGTGFYIKNLITSLSKYCPENEYLYFVKEKQMPDNIDILHIPYFEPFFLTLPIIKKQKTVVTIHDLTPLVFQQHFPSGIKGSLKWQIQKILLQNVDSIITDSESSKNDIMRFTNIPSNRIYVVRLAASEDYTVISEKETLKKIERKYKLPEKFALYVGDATWNKNLPRLVEAANKADIPLVMVGKALISETIDMVNPWNQDLVDVQKKVKNSEMVKLLGFVPTNDLISIYNLASVFVMPSLYEGFGLPVLEAMQCGCPVVTTKEGSIEEIAGDAAYFVYAYSIESIASGIKKVFSDAKMQTELSQKGILRAKSFSWDKVARETNKIYEKTH